MKKMKKVMTALAATTMSLVLVGGVAGCGEAEIKQNTQAAVSAATGVVPVEISANLAQHLHEVAVNNAFGAKLIRSISNFSQYETGSEGWVKVHNLDYTVYTVFADDGTRVLADVDDLYGEDDATIYYAKYSNKYRILTERGNQKVYTNSGDTYMPSVHGLNPTGYLTGPDTGTWTFDGGMIYSDGDAVLYATDGSSERAVFTIKNGYCTRIQYRRLDGGEVDVLYDGELYYDDFDAQTILDRIPTSLEGFTPQN